MIEPDLDAWQQRLTTLHPTEIELGLERVASVANRLRFGALAEQVVTVAGTNGKGSTIAMLERLLLDAGQRVGVYTSPHLMHYNERVRINGENASDSDLCAALAQVDEARADTSLTYFEFTTLAAFHLFGQQPLDAVLLEVGLGGRLDAVNIIDADIAVITSIALDHEVWLGDSREAIAGEKAGILRANHTFVCADRDPPAALRMAAKDLKTPSYFIGEQFDCSRNSDASWNWRAGDATFSRLPIPGLHLDCAATALQVFTLLKDTTSAIEYNITELSQSLANCHLPGRQHQLDWQGIAVVLDVAHNPAAATVLAEHLRAQPCSGKTHAVFGVLRDKQWRGMLPPLQRLVDGWFLSELKTSARAEPADSIADELRSRGLTVASVSESPCQALQQALEMARAGDRVLVFGSFHTVGPVLEWLESNNG